MGIETPVMNSQIYGGLQMFSAGLLFICLGFSFLFIIPCVKRQDIALHLSGLQTTLYAVGITLLFLGL